MKFRYMGYAVILVSGFPHLTSISATEPGTLFKKAPYPAHNMRGTLTSDLPPINIDAMAARMKTGRDLYEKVRDEGLAEYAKRHPEPNLYDERVRDLIRIQTYLWVWDDFYGEGLWKSCGAYLSNATILGARDPLLTSFCDIASTHWRLADNEEDAKRINKNLDLLLTTDYPEPFKMMACQAVILNLTNYANVHPDPQSASLPMRGRFIGEWSKGYRELIRQGIPHARLYRIGKEMQQAAQNNKESLDLLIAEQQRAFNDVDPQNPVRTILDGRYFVSAAWRARGSGYAGTVSERGWKLFEERLVLASGILEPLYDLQPGEWGISEAMMKVVLGQGLDRSTMEKWFQRALQADPDNFEIYLSKEWYLQPRWQGSVEDVLAFGEECVRTEKWEAKLPLILPIGLDHIDDSDLYADQKVWAQLEKAFRGYLDRYPDAVCYRTLFTKQAYKGGHKEIAKEQLQILGPSWDPKYLNHEDYTAMINEFGLKAQY